MNNILNIRTSAQREALVLKSDHTIESLGLINLHQVYWNLPAEALYEEIVFRGEWKISKLVLNMLTYDKGNIFSCNVEAKIKESHVIECGQCADTR